MVLQKGTCDEFARNMSNGLKLKIKETMADLAKHGKRSGWSRSHLFANNRDKRGHLQEATKKHEDS